MSEDIIQYSISDDELAKYFPERNYEARGYKPFNKPFKDLCGNCKEYCDFVYNKGLKRTPNPPKCFGHITEQYSMVNPDDFDEDEYTEFLIASDPVAWAMHMFQWKARWYQEEMLSCTSIRKVVRAGRRVGKTLCVAVRALWRLATASNQTILVICPFEVQVQKIFDEIHSFIAMSPALSAAVKRSTRTPSRLDFNNGSKILGFSSGNNNAAGSDKIRGQDATDIIIDEADYINEMDIEAILAILASHPDCGLWASSTPTGLHKKFYQFCVQKDLDFKEFWYISSEAPNWTPEVEDFFRRSWSKTGFEHEFLAEFGIQEAGVFRNDLINRALSKYKMPRKRTPNSRVVIGADWNGQAIGAHLVVLEAVVDKDDNIKYIPLEKKIIRGGNFTQHEAVQAIIDLDAKYKADYIYVDAGYGEVQVEMLQKHGRDTKGSNLQKKVKAYAMQANIEIKDPATGFKVKKNAKPFMVNMAVMQLEEDRIILPVGEDTAIVARTVEGEESGGEQGLVQQMRNFSILRVSANGLPSYSQGEDHTLTAWMLALVGFVLEFSDLRRRRSYIPSQFVGLPGESKEEAENHELVRFSENLRELDPNTNLPQYNNIGSIAKAISQGDRLRKAFEAARKYQRARNYSRDRGFRKADLGSPRMRRSEENARRGGKRRMF